MKKYILLSLVPAFFLGFLVFAQAPSFEISQKAEPEVNILSFSSEGNAVEIRVQAVDVSGINSVVAVVEDSSGQEKERKLFSFEGNDFYGIEIPTADYSEGNYTVYVFASDNLGYSNNVEGGNFDISPSGGGNGDEEVYGCTDPSATNYNSNATVDDGSCEYLGTGDVEVSFSGIECGSYVEDLEMGMNEAFYNYYCSETLNYLNNNEFVLEQVLQLEDGLGRATWRAQESVPGDPDLLFDIEFVYDEESNEWTLLVEETSTLYETFFLGSSRGSDMPSILHNKSQDSLCLDVAGDGFGTFVCLYGGSATINQEQEPEEEISSDVFLFLDPDYIQETEEERSFRPTDPFSPFDDIVCELQAESSHYSSEDTFEGKLVTVDSNGEETEVARGILSYSYSSFEDPEVEALKIFQWKINGWPSGWTSNNEVMDEIIENKNVKCKVETLREKAESIQKPVNLCVQLWGDIVGRDQNTKGFRFVSMRAESRGFTVSDIIREGKALYQEGLWEVSPFSHYKESFEYYVDLATYNDFDKERVDILDNAYNDSSCQNMNLYFIHQESSDSNILGVTKVGAKVVIVYSNNPKFSPIVSVHETGHYFTLNDEYLFTFGYYFSAGDYTNCTPLLFHEIERCEEIIDSFPEEGESYMDCFRDCGNRDSFRFSLTSLMMSAKDFLPKFNFASCVIVLRELFNSSEVITEGDPSPVAASCTGDNVVAPYFCTNDRLCNVPSYGTGGFSIYLEVEGCGECQGNKCEFLGAGRDCRVKTINDQYGHGYCLRPDNPNGPFICETKDGWECNSMGGCGESGVCDLETHECTSQ